MTQSGVSTPILEPLDATALRTRRLDLISSLLSSGVLAVIEMGGAIAKKGFNASDFQVALLISGQSAGLMLSFFIAHLASYRSKVPLVFWPEFLGRVLLLGVFFLDPSLALVFVIIHASLQMLQAITLPARITIYRLNYPTSRRGAIVGRIRQLQLVLTAVAALAMSLALDWSTGKEELTRWLGKCPVLPHQMFGYVIPALAIIGILGCLVFRRIEVREAPATAARQTSLAHTFRRFVEVYRADADFRRYENFFFLFGFANIMSIPLVQIHAVDELKANYLDLALINVVLVQGIMAATMGFWGKLVDRHSPNALRGVLNIIFSIDFLLLAVAPTMGWVYFGRVFRGIAMGGGTLIWMLGSLYYARSKEEAPIYLGIHTVLTGLRWLLAPFAGVLLKQAFGHSARPIFLISFAVILLSAILMLRDSRRQRPRRPVEEPIPAQRIAGS
jgi:MFS family permease